MNLVSSTIIMMYLYLWSWGNHESLTFENINMKEVKSIYSIPIVSIG